MHPISRDAAAPSPAEPTVAQAYLAVGASVAVGAFAAYQSFVWAVSELGTAPAAVLSLFAFIVASAVALVGAARLDASH